METWQRKNITDNEVKLHKIVECNKEFLETFHKQRVLTEDLAGKLSTSDKNEKVKFLLEIIQNHTHGYGTLLKSLSQTNQTRAIEVLLQNVSSTILEDLKITISGRVSLVKSVLSTAEIVHLWSEIKSIFKVSAICDFWFDNQLQNNQIKLIDKTIPTPLPFYIPRTLSKRVHLNPAVLKQKLEDIFVIQGVTIHKLSAIVKPNIPASSSDQLHTITTRFIVLVKSKHWEQLRCTSVYPIHLILYDEERKSYVLEETVGDSKNIRHNLEFRHQGDIKNSEEQVLEVVTKYGNRGLCICELPGMGKTQVLANLARKMSQNLTNNVVFIRLQQFAKTLYLKYQNQAKRNPEILLWEHITNSSIGALILQKIVQKLDVKFHIFLDGFDEINSFSVQQFLKRLTTKSYISLYVTSRSHMRNELEDSLGVLAYDILPFSMENQINFLTKYWNNKYPEILVSRFERFAKLCLQSFNDNMPSGTIDIAGIPIQCRLIADVYEENAIRFCRTDIKILTDQMNTFEKSLGELYKKFIDIKFSYENPEMLATECVDSSNLNVISHEHKLLALREVFPRARFTAHALLKKSRSEDVKPILSFGLLEEVYYRKNVFVQFVHRTVAEFLVAEFIVEQLLNNVLPRKNASRSILLKSLEVLKRNQRHHEVEFNLFLFGIVLKTQHSIKSKDDDFMFDPFCFKNSTVMYFLDHLLNSLSTSQCSQVAMALASPPEREDMHKIITSCGVQNLVNMFSLMQSICTSNPRKLKLFASKECICKIMLKIFCCSNEIFISKCVVFFRDFCSFTVDDMMNICEKKCWMTPPQYACQRKMFDKLECFIALKCTTECQHLLHICVSNSFKDGQDKVERRKEMINLLLESNPNLLKEKDSHNKVPLLQHRINFKLVKFLVAKGADIYATEKEDNTIAHLAVNWMDSKSYHELVVYFLNDLKAVNLFKLRNKWGYTPLQSALEFIKPLRMDTIKIILNETGLSINDKNGNGENLIFSAVRKNQEIETLKMLINLGADYHTRNKNGKNLLYVCNCKKHAEIEKYLKSLG